MNLFRRAIALNQKPTLGLEQLRKERNKPSPPANNLAFGHTYSKFDDLSDHVRYKYSIDNRYQIVVTSMPGIQQRGQFLWALSLIEDERHVNDLQIKGYDSKEGFVQNLSECDISFILSSLKKRLDTSKEEKNASVWQLYTSLMLKNASDSGAGQVYNMLQSLQDKAKHGDKEAQYRLGSLYYYGKAVSKDYKRALYWLKQSATSDYAPAQYMIGYMFGNGIGLSQDVPTAMVYYKLSAGQGYAPAVTMLKQSDLQFDSGLAQRFHNYLYDAHKKDPEAQYQLGLLYRYNKNELLDIKDQLVMDIGTLDLDKEAFKLFDGAANAGHAESQHEMGETYFYGYGVSASPDRAIEWYEKAAEQNYKPSIDKLQYLKNK